MKMVLGMYDCPDKGDSRIRIVPDSGRGALHIGFYVIPKAWFKVFRKLVLAMRAI